jgi:hypothetical protein
LAQRLERRKQASLLQHSTIDSWDFPTTLFFPSPTQSVFRHSQIFDGGPKCIDELDEKDDELDEKTGGATLEDRDGSNLNSTTEHPQVAAQDAETAPTTDAMSPSKSCDAGHPITVLNSESLTAKTSTPISVASPTPAAAVTSLSVPVLPNEVVSPPPNQSLWRRIRRSHTKEAT